VIREIGEAVVGAFHDVVLCARKCVDHLSPVQECVARGGHQQVALRRGEPHRHVRKLVEVTLFENKDLARVPGRQLTDLARKVSAGIASWVDQAGFECSPRRM